MFLPALGRDDRELASLELVSILQVHLWYSSVYHLCLVCVRYDLGVVGLLLGLLRPKGMAGFKYVIPRDGPGHRGPVHWRQRLVTVY
jgi:hypothetical protein